jgi:hypothetical protein
VRRTVVPITLSLLLLLLSGCATSTGTTSPPSWLDRPYDKSYSEAEYLVAVGSGSTREQAVDAARSALSQIFKSEVRSVTELTTYSTSTTDEAGQSTFTQAAEMLEMGRVSSTTDALIASEVANVYTDPLARVHARVVMNRAKSVELYRGEVQQLALQRSALRTRRLMTGDRLAQYVLLLEELGLGQIEQGFLDQIQVLTGKSQAQVVLPISQELRALASTITVDIELDAPESARALLRAAFEAALQGLGFATVHDHGAYHLQVVYSAEEVVMEKSPYHYVRYNLNSQLGGDSIVYFSHSSGGREAALGSGEAWARAQRTAASDGVSEFLARLLQDLATQ